MRSKAIGLPFLNARPLKKKTGYFSAQFRDASGRLVVSGLFHLHCVNDAPRTPSTPLAGSPPDPAPRQCRQPGPSAPHRHSGPAPFVCNPLIRRVIESYTSAAPHSASWEAPAERSPRPTPPTPSPPQPLPPRPICQLGRPSHWRQPFLLWLSSDSAHAPHELNPHFRNPPDDLPTCDLGNLEDVHDRIPSILSTSCDSGLVTCFCIWAR